MSKENCNFDLRTNHKVTGKGLQRSKISCLKCFNIGVGTMKPKHVADLRCGQLFPCPCRQIMTMFNDSCGKIEYCNYHLLSRDVPLGLQYGALNSVFSVQVTSNASSFTQSCFNYAKLLQKEKRNEKINPKILNMQWPTGRLFRFGNQTSEISQVVSK